MCLLTHFGELVPWTRDEVQVYLSGQSAFGVEKSTHTWLELWSTCMGKKADRRRIDDESRAELDMNILRTQFLDEREMRPHIIFGKIPSRHPGLADIN